MSWDTFGGTILRSLTADDLHRLEDQRVALVGDPAAVTGAVTQVARRAQLLKVFQTDGVWVLPRLGPVPSDTIAALLPLPLRRRLTEVVAGLHLRRQVPDPWIRRHLTPTRTLSRGTLVTSSSYYRSLRRSNVELVMWPIASVVPAGIRTADGVEHHVDVVVRLT